MNDHEIKKAVLDLIARQSAQRSAIAVALAAASKTVEQPQARLQSFSAIIRANARNVELPLSLTDAFNDELDRIFKLASQQMPDD